MTALLVVSILLLIGAACWAVVLGVRPVDRRFRLVAGAIVLVSALQILSLVAESLNAVPGQEHSHVTDLVMAAALLLTAYFVGRAISRHTRLQQDIASERSRISFEINRLEKTIETTQIGVCVTDLTGRIVYVNPAEAEMHGWTVDELTGQDVGVLAPHRLREPMSPAEIAKMTSWRRESVNVRKDGTTFPVHLMSDVVHDADGNPVNVVTTCENISARKAAEQALRESEERYALSARGANDGLWDWNIDSGDVYFSDRWKAILGYSDQEIEPKIDAWLDRVHPEDLERVKGELDTHLIGHSVHYENEHRVRHWDRTYRWVLVRAVAVRDEEGRPHRMAGSLTDITPRKQVEEQLAKDALYDPLTGLPNRAFFSNILQRSSRRARRRRGYQFAVLFLDLDRFKVVNDSLGHDVGDELLVSFAERLERCLRPGDVVARLAGDEFCILLDDIKEINDPTRVAERIQEELRAPFLLGKHELYATVSIGIASSGSSTDGPEHLLRDADTAMYRAKARGRARFEVFDKEMHARAMAVLELEHDLRVALERDQFVLEYQPVVALEGNRVSGFEALVRWDHPGRGMVPPEEFVPIAEETGLIVPLGFWVLRTACKQMVTWLAQFPELEELFVSVNVAEKQLQQPDFVERVSQALREADLGPHRLKLEIAETVLMEDPEYMQALVSDLANLGVQVQIDDFGTGYSSLSYLNRFNIDTLKIDRSFVSRVSLVGEKSVVVQAVIKLARDLGIRVIAEGVETEEQSEHLKLLRCEEGQGFLYSKPVDGKEAAQILEGQAAKK
ncbi:MAG: EAL domain-containing protein [Gemmatimonadota bacterium]|nr:MAG: EAL domain-containing protein [Gemmatimonadota bacterium]